MGNYIGKVVKRVEDPRFIQGKGRYIANLNLPGMSYAAIKRSPHAHANIKSINVEKARNMEGVIAVMTGKDLAESGLGTLPCGFTPPDIKLPPYPALAIDKIRYMGHGVAVVVAESRYLAQDALDLIEVNYEVLDAVVDAKKAREEGAPQVHEETPNNTSFYWPIGDKEAVEKAISEADHVVDLNLINQRLVPNAMEPRAVVAQWDDFSGEMTVWTTTQNPHVIRVLMSAFTLFIPENKLRVISPDVGGGFGSKIFHYPEEIIIPWLSKALNRSVKWVSLRSESFVTDAHGRDHVTNCKLALKSDGTFTGLYVSIHANMGGYLSLFAPMVPSALCLTLLNGIYTIPAIYGETYGVMTHTVPVDAYRGAGRPEASYMVERLINIAAQELNMDPLEIRRKNLIQPDAFPFQTQVALVYDSGNYPGLLDKAEEVSGYQAMRAAQKQARGEGKLVGIGVSTCIEACGVAPSKAVISLGAGVGLWESGSIRVHPTGMISVFTGNHSHGQGHETTFAQVVADELGVPIENIEVIHGDTGRSSMGLGTYGSRSNVGMAALSKTAEKIREKVIKIAAHQLEASVEDMVYDQEKGEIHVKGSPDKKKAFGEIAFACLTAHELPDGMEPGLEETSFYDPENFVFPNSAHICLVEIDRNTGEVEIKKYTAIDDVGKVINPMIVEGQIQGGIAQGVGQALWEHGAYDDQGQLLAGSMMDYAMPKAGKLVDYQVDRTETPSPHNPLGVKGVGEMGTIASTVSMANAVMDALSPLGIKHLDMPLTAEKIWNAIQNSGS
ncbi:MAG: xanthine dehydrogenase family protein molybdopterin-binding subunit [SAR324 cluster bacterium]|nr:xanthine dehydrogenase family protein molybdopterin-binding subunit [SAR324 cluster bacterium]